MYEYTDGPDKAQSSGQYNGPKRVTKIVETVYDESGRVVTETETVESEYFDGKTEGEKTPKFDFDLGKGGTKSPFPGGGFVWGGGVDDGILNVAANTDWAAVAKKVADDIKNRYNLS